MTREQKNTIINAILDMPESTKIERARKDNAFRHFDNIDNDNGAVGRIREILAKSAHSKQTNFAKQGKADCFVWLDGNRYNAEYKTNGGRIGALYGAKAPRFVVYEMDVCNSGTSNRRRVVEPIVMRTEMFLEILAECGAIKSTNGTNPEPAIQVTSKTLYVRLSEYTLHYDPNRRYTAEDFE